MTQTNASETNSWCWHLYCIWWLYSILVSWFFFRKKERAATFYIIDKSWSPWQWVDLIKYIDIIYLRTILLITVSLLNLIPGPIACITTPADVGVSLKILSLKWIELDQFQLNLKEKQYTRTECSNKDSALMIDHNQMCSL